VAKPWCGCEEHVLKDGGYCRVITTLFCYSSNAKNCQFA
jgi:hypothetical protein